MAAHAVPGAPDILRAAYVELVVTDVAAARWFWVDVLGLVVTAETPDALYLRGFEETTHHSLVLRRGDAPANAAIAYRVRSGADLDLAERWFAERGCPVERRPAGAVRGVGPAVRVVDPLGFTVELFADIERTPRLHQRYDLRRGAEIGRIDHFNVVVPDVAAAHRHHTELGFGCSETIEGDGRLYAAWMHRKQTVHDVAFTGGRGPRLHHTGFYAPEAAQVLRTCDLLGSLRAESHIERGPGRHGVSNAFYVYLRDPDGHRLEVYTSDYYTGDPDHETVRWDVHDDRRRDFWGSAVVPSWYAEATTVLDLSGRPQPQRDIDVSEATVVGADGLGR